MGAPFRVGEHSQRPLTPHGLLLNGLGHLGRGCGWRPGSFLNRSRTGKGSSLIGAPSRPAGPALPIAPLSAPGCSTAGEHVVEPRQRDAVEASDAEVLRHPQPEGLRGEHHPGREEVGLALWPRSIRACRRRSTTGRSAPASTVRSLADDDGGVGNLAPTAAVS